MSQVSSSKKSLNPAMRISLPLYLVHHYYANHMSEGGKDAIKKTGYQNRYMERMQFEKK
jgi:hypothetical protein